MPNNIKELLNRLRFSGTCTAIQACEQGARPGGQGMGAGKIKERGAGQRRAGRFGGGGEDAWYVHLTYTYDGSGYYGWANSMSPIPNRNPNPNPKP